MSRELEEAKYLFREGEACKLDVVQALDEVFKVPDVGASHESEEGNIMPDPVPLNEDANRNDDVPYDSEVEHVDKLGEHKGGGFCSQT